MSFHYIKMETFILPQINIPPPARSISHSQSPQPQFQPHSFKYNRPRRKRQVKKIPATGNWTPEEDKLLMNLVEGSTEKKHWQTMATYFVNKTPQQIMNRWNKVINPSLVKGNWTQEEDAILTNWVHHHGEKGWTKVASRLPGRIGKQCRERWVNCLKPNIKRSEWTEEEDNKIIELQSTLGNKWAKMAEIIEGRTDNQIKNRWNSVLKKKLNSSDKDDIFRLDDNLTFSDDLGLTFFDENNQKEDENPDDFGNYWFDDWMGKDR